MRYTLIGMVDDQGPQPRLCPDGQELGCCAGPNGPRRDEGRGHHDDTAVTLPSTPRYPPQPKRGDRVAIVSPSSGLPGVFPTPYELGLQRLRDDFDLVPVEYPTTRRMDSTPADRAADLHAAFRDPTITAIITSIGGDDQIRVLPHLDRDLIAANPKPFFGYSDNTNLLVYLWNAGVVGYHGGSVMYHLGRPMAMHSVSSASFGAALFDRGDFVLVEPQRYGDVDLSWSDPGTFQRERPSEPAEPWTWHSADRIVDGVTWGGNLEVLSWLAMADIGIQPPDAYAGCVLMIETSEEMPSAVDVYRVLRSLGERGMLRQFRAVLVGRAKAWSLERPLDDEAKLLYRRTQREAVTQALGEYGSGPLIVFDVDFGHTEPQFILPFGGRVRVDGPRRQIAVTY